MGSTELWAHPQGMQAVGPELSPGTQGDWEQFLAPELHPSQEPSPHPAQRFASQPRHTVAVLLNASPAN